jgi:hypothetical protein
MQKLEKSKNRRLYLFGFLLFLSGIIEVGALKTISIIMVAGFVWLLIELTLEVYFILREAKNG